MAAGFQLNWDPSSKVYVGNLSEECAKEEVLREVFSRFGPIIKVQLSSPGVEPRFAFLSFESEADAFNAAKALDGSAQVCTGRRVIQVQGSNKSRDCKESH